MAKERYQYFIAVQNPDKARFSKRYPYVNQRAWTNQAGEHFPEACKSAEPGSNGIYVVDMEAEFAKEKLARMLRVVKKGVDPVMGPFDTITDATVAERKIRPLTVEERLARADANQAELEALRLEVKQNKKNSQ